MKFGIVWLMAQVILPPLRRAVRGVVASPSAALFVLALGGRTAPLLLELLLPPDPPHAASTATPATAATVASTDFLTPITNISILDFTRGAYDVPLSAGMPASQRACYATGTLRTPRRLG